MRYCGCGILGGCPGRGTVQKGEDGVGGTVRDLQQDQDGSLIQHETMKSIARQLGEVDLQ
jgi:hypothetical protein